MDLEIVVGNNQSGVGDGAPFTARGGKTGELVVGLVHPTYYEAASRGRVFTATVGVGGVAPGTAVGTTPGLYLHNPVGSGVWLVPIKASCGYVSGTLGAGQVLYTTNLGAASANPTGGTSLTPVATNLGNGATSSGKAFTGSTTATQTALRSTGWILGASLATTAALPSLLVDLLDGEFVIQPGFGLGLQGLTAAGTSPLVIYSMSWEEVRIT